jgi:DNA-binding PadR family transcriptional regulator
MIRYKYGPWDDDYYPLIGSLISRGLIEVDHDARGTLRFALTDTGRVVAERLRGQPEWSTVAVRSELLRQEFDTTGNRLRERIYRELPDVVDRPHRSEI